MLRIVLWWTALVSGVLVWLPLVRGATQGAAHRWALAPGTGGRGIGGDYWLLLVAAALVGPSASTCRSRSPRRSCSAASPAWRRSGWRVTSRAGGSLLPPRDDRPAVFLIVIDTLRADHLGVYGHSLPTSPRLDALVAEGLVFERAYSHSSWTLPSFGSLFTGLYPSEHGALRVDGEWTRSAPEQPSYGILRADAPTVAEAYRAAGYRTAAFLNNMFLEADFGFGARVPSPPGSKRRSRCRSPRERPILSEETLDGPRLAALTSAGYRLVADIERGVARLWRLDDAGHETAEVAPGEADEELRRRMLATLLSMRGSILPKREDGGRARLSPKEIEELRALVGGGPRPALDSAKTKQGHRRERLR